MDIPPPLLLLIVTAAALRSEPIPNELNSDADSFKFLWQSLPTVPVLALVCETCRCKCHALERCIDEDNCLLCAHWCLWVLPWRVFDTAECGGLSTRAEGNNEDRNEGDSVHNAAPSAITEKAVHNGHS